MSSDAAVSPGALAYVAHGFETVPGFFNWRDARLFTIAQEAQRACGVHGSILEIGAFMGRSAVLFGFFCDALGEGLVVSDIFESDETNEESKSWRLDGLEKPGYAEFVAQYSRFHHDLPEIITGPSLELDADALGRDGFRLIHIDGAHDWMNVGHDLDLLEALASDDALVVFDDVCNRRYPAVGARVWSDVVAGRFRPLAVTDKLYAARSRSSAVGEAFQRRIQEATDLRATFHTIADTQVLVVLDAGSRDGSRTTGGSTRSASWKRVARDVLPPMLYRGAARLGRRLR